MDQPRMDPLRCSAGAGVRTEAMVRRKRLRVRALIALCTACVAQVVIAQPDAVPVRIATVASVAEPARYSAPAEVLAPHRSVLSAQTTATVERVAADVGASVSEGELLVQLDDTDARLAHQQAKAQENAARAQARLAEQRLQRGRELGTRDFISQDELLALQTGVEAAAADIEIARAATAIAARMLAKTSVQAPFDGTVVERSAQQGALAVPGTPLVTVVSTATPEASAAVPADRADTLRDASSLRFEGSGVSAPVQLLRLVDAVDRSARTREARLAFEGDAPLPGSTGTLRWEVVGGNLPARLLVRRDGRLGVFRVEDGTARFQPVPGAQEGRSFSAALAPDLQLVVEGQAALQDGSPVAVQP